MLAAEEMPDDNAELANIRVEFDSLSPDSPAGCPVPFAKVLAYLADEVPDGEALTTDDVIFVRTARVVTTDYWVWRFREPGPNGDDAYATVSRSGKAVTVGYGANYYGLTPEQFVVGDYHRVF